MSWTFLSIDQHTDRQTDRQIGGIAPECSDQYRYHCHWPLPSPLGISQHCNVPMPDVALTWYSYMYLPYLILHHNHVQLVSHHHLHLKVPQDHSSVILNHPRRRVLLCRQGPILSWWFFLFSCSFSGFWYLRYSLSTWSVVAIILMYLWIFAVLSAGLGVKPFMHGKELLPLSNWEK